MVGDCQRNSLRRLPGCVLRSYHVHVVNQGTRSSSTTTASTAKMNGMTARKIGLTSTFLIAKQAAARMIALGAHGKIIKIGSLTSELTRTTVAPLYCGKGRHQDADQGNDRRVGGAEHFGQRHRP